MFSINLGIPDQLVIGIVVWKPVPLQLVDLFLLPDVVILFRQNNLEHDLWTYAESHQYCVHETKHSSARGFSLAPLQELQVIC